MSIKALILLTITAVVHSLWNLLAKKSMNKHIFLWLSLCFSSGAFFIPFCVFYTPIPLRGWTYAVLSGALEAAYYSFLASAYQHGEMSRIYPLARGSAPVFVAIFAYLFLGEIVSPLGILGISLIIGGIVVFHWKILSKGCPSGFFRSFGDRNTKFALLTGLMIACYSTVDKKGVTYTDPFLYIYLVFLSSAIFLVPFMWRKRGMIKEEIKLNRTRIALVGTMNVTAYLLVLLAMTWSKVSYVSSVREISIIFTPILGALFLKERFGWEKLAGAGAIFGGVILIAFAE